MTSETKSIIIGLICALIFGAFVGSVVECLFGKGGVVIGVIAFFISVGGWIDR